MKDEYGLYYDLPSLLKFNGPGIAELARINPSLRVGKYFHLLSVVEVNLPKCAEILKITSTLHADENNLANLEYTKKLLEDIGCKKTASGIDDIICALKENRIDYAVECANKTLEDFDNLQKRIKASKKAAEKETISGVIGEHDPSNGNYGKLKDDLPLKDALILLDAKDSARKLRVLAIDDSIVMLRTVTSALNNDYEVYGIHKPAMLKKFLEQITPDLFLLDYEMPGINGFECIPIIRGFEEHKDTPIIFLTSSGTVEHVSAAHMLGAIDFIVKPFQSENLLEKVTKHIVRKKLVF